MWGKIGLENQALNSNTKVGAYFASLSISRPLFFPLSSALTRAHAASCLLIQTRGQITLIME